MILGAMEYNQVSNSMLTEEALLNFERDFERK
jgi:hypothetical protein